MAFTYAKGISLQGIQLYEFLASKGEATVKEIATALHIHPNAVYRIAHYLTLVGLVEEINTTPTKFAAIVLTQAKANLLSYQRTQFENMLGDHFLENLGARPESYQISFIQGREEIFARCAEDLRNANHKTKFIVLGLPIGVSPELMLEQKNAVERGVPIRIIVQEYSEENRQTLRSWLRVGLDVRHGKPIGFHLLLIDDTISYLMYYDPDDKTKRYAVRIVHYSINYELQKIFDTHWAKAKRIML